MSTTVQVIVSLLLSGGLLWQLASGVGPGLGRQLRVTRRENPRVYWSVIASQAAILLGVLLTGQHWHVRQ